MVRAKVEGEVAEVKKSKKCFDVLHLTTIMSEVGGESRLERLKNAVNTVGDIKGVFDFKGDVYLIVEK